MPSGYINGKPDVSWWINQLTAGIEFRKKYASQARWDIWREYYRGNWGVNILPSNIFFKMLRTVVPRIYFRNPSISIVATKPGLENILFAQLLERIDNKLIRKMKIKQEMKRIVQDAFMFGIGVGKLGYGAEFTPTPDMLDNEAPTDNKGNRFEYNNNVLPNTPWFMRVHTGAFTVPSGLMSYNDARFVIHHIQRELSDVKADPRFKNVSGLNGGTRGPASDIYKARNGAGIRQPNEMIDLFEVRDKKTQKVFVLAPYATSKVLFYGDDDLQYNGRTPFYTLTFNQDDMVFWGTPDSRILEPIQLELNETRTQIMKHRRLSLIKLIAKKNSISPTEAAKLVDETVEPVVFIDGEPLSDIRMLEGSNIPQDLFRAFEATVVDGRESVGFSRNEFGEFNPGSGDTTATEATIVKQASEIRVDERRDMLADMLTDVVEHMNHIIFNHWNEEQVVDIMGPNGVPIWVKFKPEVLKGGGYTVKVDPDTSIPETKQLRQAKAERLFTMLNGDQLIDQTRLRQYLLRESQGVELDDLILQPPGSPGSESNPLNIEQATQLLQAGGNGNA